LSGILLEVGQMVTTGYLERDVIVRELKLHYQEWGKAESPAVVMVHGFGVSGHMFDEFAERMQEQYHLLAIDQRGHGDSDWSPDGDYSREAFVLDLEGFRESLGLERFILVGHSMGGLNAVSYTNAYPHRVRALVLVDVGPESAKEGVDNIVRFTRGPDELEFEEFVELAHRFNQRRTMENIRERMRHRLKPADSGKWTWKFDKRFRDKASGLTIGSELSNDESWQLFRDVRVPTLLVRGAESDVLSAETAERATREMDRARLVTVPAAGHSVPGDNPDEFTAAVRGFLSDLENGQFAAASNSEPPPLDRLVEEHEAQRRRGPGTLTFILAGVGAVLALAGAGAVLKKRSNDRKARASVRGRARAAATHIPAVSVPTMDLDQARERAAALVSELSLVGQRGAMRARQAVHDVDLERARKAAADAAAALAEASRNAAAAAPVSVDKKELAKRGKQAANKSRSTGSKVLAATLFIAGRLAGRAKKSKKRGSRLAWRR
ncbi:MAG: alpha/beta hydrolase, partial [Tepidiformaceae bacterium]